MKPLWDRRDLAVIHACGSPDATRSHFDAQDYMETATPGVKSTADGWLNRYLQVREADERSTVQRGRAHRTAAANAAGHRAGAGDARARRSSASAAAAPSESFEAEYAQAADRVLNGVGRDAFDAMKTLKQTDPAQYRAEHGAEYPRSPFGQALQQIAQLVKAGVGLEVAFAEVGGWDTHVNQGSAQGQLATRLDDFSRGIAALVTDLGDRMADVVVLTMSEFGRAVAENGNRGTDHGHGNAMMVIGGGVRGGHVYGKWPGLGSTSSMTAATSPSRPTSATSSAKSWSATSASPGRSGFFPATTWTRAGSRGCSAQRATVEAGDGRPAAR